MRWVDGVCQRYVAVLPLAQLLPATAETAAATVLATPGCRFAPRDLVRVRAEIERLATRPRLVRSSPQVHEAIDEIDVALDDLMKPARSQRRAHRRALRAVSTWCAGLAQADGAGQAGFARRRARRPDPRHRQDHHAARRSSTPRAADRGGVRRSCGAHAADGAAIIAEIPLLAHLEPAVRHHHERYDGERLPRRDPAGEAIPAAARISASPTPSTR